MKHTLSILIICLCAALGLQAQTLTPAAKDGKYGYRNAKGGWAIQPQFDQAGDFTRTHPLAPVRKGRQSGFIDMKGRFVIGCYYEEVGKEFTADVVEVCLNGKWGIIDLNGQVIVPIKYDLDECRDRLDNAAKKAAKLRKKRNYEIVDRRLREAADAAKAVEDEVKE